MVGASPAVVQLVQQLFTVAALGLPEWPLPYLTLWRLHMEYPEVLYSVHCLFRIYLNDPPFAP